MGPSLQAWLSWLAPGPQLGQELEISPARVGVVKEQFPRARKGTEIRGIWVPALELAIKVGGII